jgi:hypothetical protein
MSRVDLQKGCAPGVKKKLFINAIVTILVLLIFAGPALAITPAPKDDVKKYNYSSMHFRYIGDIFHERTVNFQLHGGSAYFLTEGKGSASGSHYVTDVEFEKRNPASEVYRITALSLQAYMTGTTALDAAEDEKLLIMSVINLPKQDVEMSTGVEMDPGETGFIKHDIMSSQSTYGDYLKMTNHFGNTGGTTKRVLEITGYLKDQMRVDGYAEVWDTTEMSDGKHKSGFWDMLP